MWTVLAFIAAIISYVIVATIAARWSMRRIERQRREIERKLEDIQRWLPERHAHSKDYQPYDEREQDEDHRPR